MVPAAMYAAMKVEQITPNTDRTRFAVDQPSTRPSASRRARFSRQVHQYPGQQHRVVDLAAEGRTFPRKRLTQLRDGWACSLKVAGRARRDSVIAMQHTRQEVVDMLRKAGLREAADEALRDLPDPVDLDRVREWGAEHGISRDDLISLAGGSP